MPKKINLIPPEMSVSPKTTRLIRSFNKIILIASIVLICTIIFAIGIYLYYSVELKKNNLSLESLKQEVLNLEQSEQKLILTKDKIAKIIKVKAKKTALYNLEILNKINLPVKEAKIEVDNIEISSIVSNSSELSFFLESVDSLGEYKNIYLQSLNLSPTEGFAVELKLEN